MKSKQINEAWGIKILHFGGKDGWKCGSIWMNGMLMYEW